MNMIQTGGYNCSFHTEVISCPCKDAILELVLCLCIAQRPVTFSLRVLRGGSEVGQT